MNLPTATLFLYLKHVNMYFTLTACCNGLPTKTRVLYAAHLVFNNKQFFIDNLTRLC